MNIIRLPFRWERLQPTPGTYLYTLEPTSNFSVDQPAMGSLRPFLLVPVPTLEGINGGRFTFSTWPGFRYQPQCSPGLPAADWTDYGSELAGNGLTAGISMPLENPAQFFRVRVRLGP